MQVQAPWMSEAAKLEPIDQCAVTYPDEELVKRVLAGEVDAFEPLVQKYQGRIFAMARRYARTEVEAEDIVQEVFIKAYQKLPGYRQEAPFEHWLMRLAIRTCYDYLRAQQRRKEASFTDLTNDEQDLLNKIVRDPDLVDENVEAARALVRKILEMMPADARLVITLLDIEGKSVREVSQLTGWSVPAVKVRAFRARALMKKLLQRIAIDQYL